MNTTRTTRFAGLMVAIVMTVGIHGAMLWQFDTVAHNATLAQNEQGADLVTLESVEIVAHKS